MSFRESVSSMRAAVAGAAAILGVALAAAPAQAQNQQVPPNVKLGQTYGAWQSACETVQGAGEQCFIFQRITGANGKVAGQLKVGRLGPDKQPVLLADLPMNVLLPAGVTMQVDGGNEVRVPFMYCQPGVCSSSVTLNDQMLGKMKAGSQMNVTVVLLPAQKPMKVDASLSGFTAAYESLQ